MDWGGWEAVNQKGEKEEGRKAQNQSDYMSLEFPSDGGQMHFKNFRNA